MDQVIDDTLSEEIPELSDKEVFTKIWLTPRPVFRFIHERQYDKYVTLLLILSGISTAFDRSSMRDLGDRFSLAGVIAMCIIAGGLFGWISVYIYSGLLSWTGKWLKGNGNTRSFVRVIAFASIPSIISLIFLIPQIAIYGNEVFRSEGDMTTADWFSNILVYTSMGAELILGVWTVVLMVTGISEVQKFSIGRSIMNLIYPLIVIFVPLFLLIYLIR